MTPDNRRIIPPEVRIEQNKVWVIPWLASLVDQYSAPAEKELFRPLLRNSLWSQLKQTVKETPGGNQILIQAQAQLRKERQDHAQHS